MRSFNSLAHVLFGGVVADSAVNVIADFPLGNHKDVLVIVHFVSLKVTLYVMKKKLQK